MTLIERRNYRIAIGVSVLFHILLLFIYIPKMIIQQPGVEIFGAEIVEFSEGANKMQSVAKPDKNVTVPGPKNREVTPKPVDVNVKPQSIKEVVKEIPVSKETPKEVQPAEVKPTEVKPSDLIEKKEEIKKPSHPENPVNTKNVAENPVSDNKTGKQTTAENVGGDGNPATLGPIGPISKSLGDGSGLVAKQGMKFYTPKNAGNKKNSEETVLRIFIRPDGSLESIKPIKKSGDINLDKAAERFVRQYWQFKPNEVAYYIDVSFPFDPKATFVQPKFINSQTQP